MTQNILEKSLEHCFGFGPQLEDGSGVPPHSWQHQEWRPGQKLVVQDVIELPSRPEGERSWMLDMALTLGAGLALARWSLWVGGLGFLYGLSSSLQRELRRHPGIKVSRSLTFYPQSGLEVEVHSQRRIRVDRLRKTFVYNYFVDTEVLILEGLRFSVTLQASTWASPHPDWKLAPLLAWLRQRAPAAAFSESGGRTPG